MKKIVTFSLSLFSALGLLKIFSVVPFNRMAADDFGYATVVLSKGFWGAQISWYTSWTGRFTSTLLQTFFGTNMGGDGKAVLYSMITFALLLSAFAFFYSRLTNLKIVNLKVLLLSTVSFAALYLLTPNKKESWYWMAGSITYLWPIIFLLFGTSYLFVKKPNKVDYFLPFLFMFLAGGGNETFSLLSTLCFGGFLIYSLLVKKVNKIILPVFIGATLSFAFVYFAPGNFLRSVGGGSNQMSMFGSFLYAVSTGPQYLYSMVWNNIVFILPLLFCLAYLFSVLSMGQNVNIVESLKKIFYLSVAPIFISVIYILPSFRVLGRVPPDRSDITMAFVLSSGIIAVSFYLGQILSLVKNKDLILFLAAIILLGSSFTITSTLASDIYIAKNYSSTFDKVIMEVKDAAKSKKKGIIIVDKLPDSGLIGSADLKGYPDNEKNYSVARYYGIDALIVK